MKKTKYILFLVMLSFILGCLITWLLTSFNNSLNSCPVVIRQRVEISNPLPDSLSNFTEQTKIKPDTTYTKVIQIDKNDSLPIDNIIESAEINNSSAIKPNNYGVECFKYFKYSKVYDFDSIGFKINIQAELNTEKDTIELSMQPSNMWYDNVVEYSYPQIRNPTGQNSVRTFFYINSGKDYMGNYCAGGSLIFLYKKYSGQIAITNISYTVGIGMELKFR